ncbi:MULTISPECIES: RNA polymerase sigma factor [Sphingobacterium]|uniref:RNA polymerase sigma factor n=1 Tax=Sphingobacterium TaxID=28453 RepID=UPI00257FA39C|nr:MULTISPECIES: sigma-70 family RNA polymerase sigma factor [Sphingobacterium]
MKKEVLTVLSDSILLRRFINGDQGAFDMLFKRYHGASFQYCFKFIRDKPMSEELAMDVLFRIWKNREKLPENIEFSFYLRRALKNAVYNHFRSKLAETVHIDNIPEEKLLSSSTVDGNILDAEMIRIYEETINHLSPQKQLVFRMSREENLTYAQISEKLGISINVVEKYMVSALAICRRQLAEKLVSVLVILSLNLFF